MASFVRKLDGAPHAYEGDVAKSFKSHALKKRVKLPSQVKRHMDNG